MTIADAFPAGLSMDMVFNQIATWLGSPVVMGLILVVMALVMAPKFTRSIKRLDAFYERVAQADERRRGW